jgi:DNA-binding NarL/FixJ family response regulator
MLVIRERIVNALAAGDSKSQIASALRISPNTVSAVAEQEWTKVEQSKRRITAQAERAATRAFDRINNKFDSPNDIPPMSRLSL